MKVNVESELMKNQKHAVVMAPDQAFSVLQSSEGDSLFFSIGTDNAFYVTREARASNTGWNRIDLTSQIVALFNVPATMKAKTFAVAQNPISGQIDVGLVGTWGDVGDTLWLSLGNDNSGDSWANNTNWKSYAFDAVGVTAPSVLNIADVYMMNIPTAGGSAMENIFVDILRDPGNKLNLLDRYYIQPTAANKWSKQALAIDLTQGSITSCLGHRKIDNSIPGIYTYGSIAQTQQLIYVPQQSQYRPGFPPAVSLLNLPSGSTSIASCLDSNGYSDLYVAATDGIYYFANDNQMNKAKPTLIVPSSAAVEPNLLAGFTSLSASTVATQNASRTVVWGINAQRALVHFWCPAGQEATPSAWSPPVPLVEGTEGYSFYLNYMSAHNVLFVHLSKESLLQIAQDPVTGEWNNRNILLPATEVNDMIEYDSFTTHINVADDNGAPSQNFEVSLTSISPVSVYINDVYEVLTPTIPVIVKTGLQGSITIIQETQTITAVGYKITIPGSPAAPVDVDPMSKLMQTLDAIKTEADLKNVEISDGSGNTKPLIPSGTDDTTTKAVATGVANLMDVKNDLDGKTTALKTRSAPVAATTTKISKPVVKRWGLSFRNGCVKYHEGDEALDQLKGYTPTPSGRRSLIAQGLKAAKTTTAIGATAVGDIGDNIMMGIGDLVEWMKAAWESVTEFFVDFANNAWNFMVKIGNVIYQAIMDSVNAVAGAIEFVFQQIKVFFEDLVNWLGFLFNWDDILRTQKVIKNFIKMGVTKLANSLDVVEGAVGTAIDGIQAEINSWAGINDNSSDQSFGTDTAANSKLPGKDSPQSSWGSYHANNSFDSGTAQPGNPSNTPSDPGSGLTQAMTKVSGVITQLETVLEGIADQVKTEITDQIYSLTPVQLLKKVGAILANAGLEVLKDGIIDLIELFKLVVKGVLEILDTPIEIPVLSPLYKSLTGDDLSFLSLFGLVGGLAVNVIYKLVAGVTPYPDNADTQTMITATDPDAFFKVFFAGDPDVTFSSSTPQPNARSALATRNKAAVGAADPIPLNVSKFVCWIIAGVGSILVVPYKFYKILPDTMFTSPGLFTTVYSVVAFGMFISPGYAIFYQPFAAPQVFSLLGITLVFIRNVTDNAIGWAAARNPAFSGNNDVWKRIAPGFDVAAGVLFAIGIASSIGIDIAKHTPPKISDVIGWLAIGCQTISNFASAPLLKDQGQATKVEVTDVKVTFDLCRAAFSIMAGVAVIENN